MEIFHLGKIRYDFPDNRIIGTGIPQKKTVSVVNTAIGKFLQVEYIGFDIQDITIRYTA